MRMMHFYLSRHCFSVPNLFYTLPGAPCLADGFFRQYDSVIQIILQSLLKIDLSASVAASKQAVMPVA
jgi:hypothetical protein